MPKSQIISTIKIPDSYVQGIVLVKDHLWILNSKEKVLYKIDKERKKLVDSLTIQVKNPRGLEWDGKYFWWADDETKMIHQVDPVHGKIINSLEVPIYGIKDSAVLEALAWDGKYLWVAYEAGWSSRIHKMDVNTGEVIQSMFSNCHPRGLVTDGKYLWTLSYNMGKYPGVISRRTIMDDSDKMNLSRVFLCRTPGKEPTGITFDGEYFWITDKDMKTIQKISIPSEH